MIAIITSKEYAQMIFKFAMAESKDDRVQCVHIGNKKSDNYEIRIACLLHDELILGTALTPGIQNIAGLGNYRMEIR